MACYFTSYFGRYFDVCAEKPAVEERPAGGWNFAFERELSRRLRRRFRRKDDEEQVEAALEAVGVAIPPPPATVAPQDDTPRLRALVARYERLQLPPSKRTERAVRYARRAQTELAYELALREIAQQIEDDELSLVLALANIA